MSCSCKGPCKPSCSSQLTEDCPCETSRGQLAVYDDNCSIRRLEGLNGIPYVGPKGEAEVTDGSIKQGQIALNPPDVLGLTKLWGQDANGNFFALPPAVEGDVLQSTNGQWVSKAFGVAKNVYKMDQLRKGSGRLAAFICAENGTVVIGLYQGCGAEGVVGTDADGETVCYTLADLVEKLLIPLCQGIPVLTDADTVEAPIICTNNGLRKGVVITDSYIELAAPYPVINIHSYNVGSPGGIIAYALPGLSSPTFNASGPASVNPTINMVSIPGYNVAYRNVRIMLFLKGTTISEYYDAVLLVKGIERVRIALTGSGNADCNSAEILVKIPDDNQLNFSFLYQTQNIGTDSAVIAYAAIMGFQK